MTGARFHLSNFSSRPRRPRWLSCCQGEESRRNGRNKRDETRGGARAVTCIAALLRVILLLSPPPSFSSHTIANGALTPRSNRRHLFGRSINQPFATSVSDRVLLPRLLSTDDAQGVRSGGGISPFCGNPFIPLIRVFSLMLCVLALKSLPSPPRPFQAFRKFFETSLLPFFLVYK